MEKTENHILELATIICHVKSLERSTPVNITQKGKFSSSGDKMMDVEIDTGQVGQDREVYYTLTLTALINAPKPTLTNNGVEVNLTKEEFAALREFLNRSVSPMDNYI